MNAYSYLYFIVHIEILSLKISSYEGPVIPFQWIRGGNEAGLRYELARYRFPKYRMTLFNLYNKNLASNTFYKKLSFLKLLELKKIIYSTNSLN